MGVPPAAGAGSAPAAVRETNFTSLNIYFLSHVIFCLALKSKMTCSSGSGCEGGQDLPTSPFLMVFRLVCSSGLVLWMVLLLTLEDKSASVYRSADDRQLLLTPEHFSPLTDSGSE